MLAIFVVNGLQVDEQMEVLPSSDYANAFAELVRDADGDDKIVALL